MMNISLTDGVIHFIGIGGIGMSGIAEVLLALGYKISGSDIQINSNIERLKSQGAKIFKGQNKDNIKNVGIVVISSAIKEDNIELMAAISAKIPIMRRADMLAELMRLKKSVAVGGTHGKTTTTSMISSVLISSKEDPTVINGGVIESYGSNARLGKGSWMIVEADESDGTFTKLPATVAVVTNIDEEHLDFYGNLDNLKIAFKNFVENIPFYGFASICVDDPEALKLYESIKDRKIVSYGFNSAAEYNAFNFKSYSEKTVFDLKIKKNFEGKSQIIKKVSIRLPGKYNVLNALGAISVCYELGISINNIKKGLENFNGVRRRFSILDKINGISIIDDYAHHPTEIKNILEASASICQKKSIVIFQPHRYSRVTKLFDKFVNSFEKADILFITDIYAAGEDDNGEVSKEKLIDAVISTGKNNVKAVSDLNKLPEELIKIAQPGDYIIFIGAGSISNIAKDVVKEINKKNYLTK